MVFETNIICFGHMKHMKKSQIHRMNVALGNVGESSSADSFHRPRTPSTAAGGPPPSKREVLGDSPVKACGLAVDWI